MAQKSKSDVNYVDSNRYYNGSPYGGSYCDRYNVIEYDNGKGQVNYCNARKFCQSISPVSGVFGLTSGGTAVLDNFYSAVVPPFNTNVMGSIPDLESIVRSKVLPLRDDFNAINFILELDDIPRLFSKIGSVQDAILRYNLGFEPLKSDIEGILSSIKRIKNVFSSNHKTGGVYQLGRISATRNRSYSLDIATGDGKVIVEGNVLVNTGGYLTAYVPPIQGVNELLAVLDILGAYPDASTLWNAIPFSFVVDYFVNIGKILESYRGYWISPVIAVEKGWTWTKDTGTFKYIYLDRSNYWADLDNVVVASGSFKNFTRHGRNDRFDVPELEFKLPGLKQGLNLISLLTLKR